MLPTNKIMMNRNKIKILNNSGVTLVEIMITILIFSVIIAGINTALIAGSRSYDLNRVNTEIKEDVSIALARMKEDLMKSSSSAIVDVPANGSTYSSISFRVPSSVGSDGIIVWPSETVEYLLSSNQLLRRVEDGGVVSEDRVIAENISTLEFERAASTSNIVEITLQATKESDLGNTFTLDKTLKVQLRN